MAGRSGEPGGARPGRARVLAAAMEAIADVGPDRVRVQDVADRAGISGGHVLYYFGSRDRILADTLLLGERDLEARRDRRVRSARDTWDALERLVRMYLPRDADDVRWRLWAQLVARPPEDGSTRAALGDVVDGWAACLARVLADGVARGDLACADPRATAYRTCRLMDGYSHEMLTRAPGRTRAWAVREVLAALRDTLGRGQPNAS